MKYGIVADIHANHEAFSVALSHLIEADVGQILCLGDIVGYNASPSEVIGLLQDFDVVSINGNHDRYLLGQAAPDVSEEKLSVIDWTRRVLSAREVDYLRGLPVERVHDDRFLLVHGAPRDKDEYLLTREAIQENVSYLASSYPGIGICFFGHSHLPMVIGAGRVDMQFAETRSMRLDSARSYLVNVGSVGQPRDKCPLTSFGIFDTDGWTLTVVRLPYDIAREQEKMAAAGFDPRLIGRLAKGV